MDRPYIKMICAYTIDLKNDYVFGNAGGLPWCTTIKGDMEHFKKYTSCCVLVMGRKTFESLPCRLRNLYHLVISDKDKKDIACKDGSNPTATVSGNFDYIINIANEIALEAGSDICIIGGADILLKASSIVDSASFTAVEFKDGHVGYYDAPVYINIPAIHDNIIPRLEDDKPLVHTIDITDEFIKNITIYTFE